MMSSTWYQMHIDEDYLYLDFMFKRYNVELNRKFENKSKNLVELINGKMLNFDIFNYIYRPS